MRSSESTCEVVVYAAGFYSVLWWYARLSLDPKDSRLAKCASPTLMERPHLSLGRSGKLTHLHYTLGCAGLGSTRAPMREPHHRLGSDKPHDPQG